MLRQNGFPHPRGDGPAVSTRCAKGDIRIFSPPAGDGPVVLPCGKACPEVFSPPRWGWGPLTDGTAALGITDVFPHHVGMVRLGDHGVDPGRWFSPPAWGMVRLVWPRRRCPRGFPPPAWGWSGDVFLTHQEQLFPHFPQMVRLWAREPQAFSPPAWGWSATGPIPAYCFREFSPTRKGMVRSNTGPPDPAVVFPPAWGMVRPALICCSVVRFSPPAWGWSGWGPGHLGQLATSFPHPRGDGPAKSRSGAVAGVFSPPRGGWSAGRLGRRARGTGFPHPRGDGPSWRTKRKMSSGFPHPRGDGPIEKVGQTRASVSPPRVGMVRGQLCVIKSK